MGSAVAFQHLPIVGKKIVRSDWDRSEALPGGTQSPGGSSPTNCAKHRPRPSTAARLVMVWRTRFAFCCSNHNCVLREQKKRHRHPLPTIASAGGDPLIDNGPCPGVGKKYEAFVRRYPVPVRECFRKMVEFRNHPPTNPPEIVVVRKGNAVPDLRALPGIPGGPNH